MFQSCSNDIIPKLGEYRAEIKTKDNSTLPFKFELINESNKLIMVVENDKETLIYDDIIFEADSLKIFMPPYDAVIIAKAENKDYRVRFITKWGWMVS